MRYKLLGRTGCRVSELCLGAMTFGRHWDDIGQDDPAVNRRIFELFGEAGGNFVDTSNVYADGESERQLGELIAGDREHWVIATKYTSGREQGATKGGNSRKHMVEAVEASLRRLGTGHIDLYLVHNWDGITPVEEILRGMDDLVRQGKVVYWAFSNTPAWVVSRAAAIADLRGWAPPVAIQLRYSLLDRNVERDLLPMAEALDLAVMGYSPLARGLLAGKPLPDGAPDRTASIVGELTAVAAEIDATPAQIALAWFRRGRAGVAIPIVGATRPEQLAETLACVDLELGQKHLDRLDAVSAIDLGYPSTQLGTRRLRALTSGGTAELTDLHRRPLAPSTHNVLD